MNARFPALVLAVAGLALPSFSQPVEKSVPLLKAEPGAMQQSRIDVVFVLDTTGSMGGLIDGAKRKVWSIANQMASAKPAPKIRIGLVGYRDRGDEYITRITKLTDDLDAVYSDLMKFSAQGGGDGPESVNQALNEAVTKFDWTEDSRALKLIYLVGDAPPHMDYEQDVKYATSCTLAAKAGISINTIQCGNMTDTTPIWQEIARKAEGEYFAIQQDGGAVAIATPFDEDLARLGTELEKTVVAYGSQREQVAQEGKMRLAADLSTTAAAKPEATAERAVYKASAAGAMALCGTNDLVQACQDKRVDLSKLAAEELNKEMQGMTPGERQAFIDQKIKDRTACQTRINEVSLKRQDFIQQKLAEAGATKDSFDTLVFECIKRQGAKCGITYPEAKK